MIAGHLREFKGYYYIVLSYKDDTGKRRTSTLSTSLKVKGNKRKAEELLIEARKNYKRQENNEPSGDMYFHEYLLMWLSMMKYNVTLSTYSGYERLVKNCMYPYFSSLELRLDQLAPKHIQNYYTFLLDNRKLSANSVIHRHANIRKALQYAVKTGLIQSNPADLVEKPKLEKYTGKTYGVGEIETLLKHVKGNRIEFAVLMGAYYGLRRSEIIGLKWDCFDFVNKSFTIRHTVTEACISGEQRMIAQDKTKTESSRRSLPLIEPIEQYLIALRKRQEDNRCICGNSYYQKDSEYIYVDDVGRLTKPSYVTKSFTKILKTHNLKQIRFHDLRHSCASLLFANGVSLREIQEWLGHSNISTTANIYTHLSFETKIASANKMVELLSSSEEKI